MQLGPFRVLIADDSEDDRFFLSRAIGQTPYLELVGEVQTGQETIEYLRGDAPFGDRNAFPVPDVLLLDLKMPVGSGFEVLEWLQRHPHRDLHVVVFSSSASPGDRIRAQQLGAHRYEAKPVLLSDYHPVLRRIQGDLLTNYPRTRTPTPMGFPVPVPERIRPRS